MIEINEHVHKVYIKKESPNEGTETEKEAVEAMTPLL